MLPVTYNFIEADEFTSFFVNNRAAVFSNDFDFNVEKVLSFQEKERRQAHAKALEGIHRYYLVAKIGNEIVGWSFGMQKSAEEYYMINSAVFPEYRRKGIYSQLLIKSVDLLTELGVQRVYSKHKMSNNQILISKLKFGFVITVFEVNDVFGNLVELSYYTNPQRRELLEIRIGTQKPDLEKMKLIR